jgi:hypothetical protein
MRVTVHLPLLVCLGLAACAGVQPPGPVLPNFPGDNESVGAEVMNSPGLGVAVLDAGIDGLQCAEGRVVLARADASGFIAAREVVLPTTYADRVAVGAVELAPGTYHIVHYTCRNGSNVTYAGQPGDGAAIPWMGQTWPVSLAAFTVGPGEVIDAGRLSLKRTGGGLIDLGKKKGKKGFATASVTALPPEATARLAAERPRLAQRMKPQVMVLSPAATSVKIGRCHLVADAAGSQTGKKVKKNAVIGGSMIATSFSGPEAPLTACTQEGGKSDQLQALVGEEESASDTGEGASGQ